MIYFENWRWKKIAEYEIFHFLFWKYIYQCCNLFYRILHCILHDSTKCLLQFILFANTFYMKNQYCTKLLNYFELNMQNCENWLIWTFEKEFERLIKVVCIQVDYSNMKFDWKLKMERISARINDIKCKKNFCGMIRNMDLIIQRFPNHNFQPNRVSFNNDKFEKYSERIYYS